MKPMSTQRISWCKQAFSSRSLKDKSMVQDLRDCLFHIGLCSLSKVLLQVPSLSEAQLLYAWDRAFLGVAPELLNPFLHNSQATVLQAQLISVFTIKNECPKFSMSIQHGMEANFHMYIPMKKEAHV